MYGYRGPVSVEVYMGRFAPWKTNAPRARAKAKSSAAQRSVQLDLHRARAKLPRASALSPLLSVRLFPRKTTIIRHGHRPIVLARRELAEGRGLRLRARILYCLRLGVVSMPPTLFLELDIDFLARIFYIAA